MSVLFVRKPRPLNRSEDILDIPKFTRIGGCYLIIGIIFAVICIILSACSESGFSRIDIHTISGKFEVTFLALCLLSMCAFLIKLLPVCAANVNLIDPPTGNPGNKRSQSRSSSELSLSAQNLNGSRRGSTASTPYEFFANAVRRPSSSSTASVTASHKAPKSPNLNVPSTVEKPTNPVGSSTIEINVDAMPPPYDSVNKNYLVDKENVA